MTESSTLDRMQQLLQSELREKETLLGLLAMLEGNSPEHVRQTLDEIRLIAGADLAIVTVQDGESYRPWMWVGQASLALQEGFRQGIPQVVVRQMRNQLGRVYQLLDTQDHLLAPSMQAFGVRASLVLSFSSGDSLEGLVLHRFQRREGWSEAELRLLRSAAHALGAVITRIERAKQLEARNRELAVVAQVGQALNWANSLEEAAQALTNQIISLTGANLASVKVVTADGQGLRNILALGFPALTGDVVPHGVGLSWQAIATQQAQVSQNALGDPRVYIPPIAGVEHWPGSVAYVPMFDAEGRPLGVLGLGYWEQGGVCDDNLKTLEIIANIAANTLERLRADVALRERNHELELTLRLSEALKQTMSLEEVAQVALEQTLELTRSPSVALFTLSPDGTFLTPNWSRGIYSVWTPIPKGQGLSWLALQTKEMQFTANSTQDPRSFNPPNQPAEDLPKSRVAVPLFGFNGQAVGVLGVTQYQSGAFNSQELRILKLIGEVVSSALERIEATAQLMRQLHESQVLFNTIKTIASDASGPIWGDLLRAAVDLVPNAEAGSILLKDRQDYVMVAQHGYDDGLLGMRLDAGVRAYWFGPEHNLHLGMPRLGRKDFIRQAMERSKQHLRPEQNQQFEVLGRLPELQCTLCVPILNGGELVAYVNLDNLSDEMALNQESVRVGQRFALQIAALVTARQQKEALQTANEESLRTIGLALEARDPQTSAHTQRVVELALRLGQRVGLSAQQLFNLRWGAYLHDIGKLAVPDAILFKTGVLTPLERQRFARHAAEGEVLTRQLSFLPEGARAVIRHHHERWDGQGYPDGLAGEAIPLKARIFAVCDVFDALLSERPYKAALSLEQARQELLQCAQNGHLDPRLVEVFLGLDLEPT